MKEKSSERGTERVGIKLVFSWLLASVIGWSIGFALGCSFGPAVGGLAFGAVVVGLQSVVLGRFLEMKGNMVLAGIIIGAIGTTIGGLFGGPVGSVIGLSIGAITFGSIHGLSVGIALWIVFRKRISHGWIWIINSGLGGFAGMATGFAVSCGASLLAGTAGGAIFGSITVIALFRILKVATDNGHSHPGKSNGTPLG